ncbi:hypothetical protein Syun_016957 [Stephania yunnanensis]|uniref:Uncharacterized protein n=1 Tax=Stephania yunnanensis TaxID=152371 RepID=A0AAP0J7L4_9MAGN
MEALNSTTKSQTIPIQKIKIKNSKKTSKSTLIEMMKALMVSNRCGFDRVSWNSLGL